MKRAFDRATPRVLAGCLCATLALWGGPLAAQDDADDDPLEPRFDPATPFGPRGPELSFEVQLEAQRDANREGFDEDEERDNAASEIQLTLGLEQPFGERLEAVAELDLRARRLSNDAGDDSDLSFRVERLYVDHENAADTRRLRLGRQEIDDPMRWFVDEELDGLRYSLERGITRLDLSFTRESWIEIGDEDRDDIVYNALLALRVDASDESRWLPYVMHRSEREFDDARAAETTWLGLQGVIRPSERFRYWLNAAARTGEQERADEDADRALGGVAADFGLTWLLERRFRPALTVGFASSSGDSDPDDGTDDTFRQSGLHSNRFDPNDRNRFRYLGEVLDPELTNLEVITLGLGLQLDRRWSADLVWHSYRQVEEEARLRGTDYELDPTGESDDLGRALDLVIGYERSRRLEFLAVAGRYEPGTAFAGRPDAAWLFRLEVEWELEL